MARFIDLTNNKFGRLVAIRPTDKRGADGSVVWECMCECGNTSLVTSTNLRSGNTLSCGCYERDLMKMRIKTNEIIKSIDGYYIGITSNTGNHFLFDEQDYSIVSEHTWREDAYGYIVTDIDGKRSIRLHRLLLENPNSIIDHKNGNPKDNRRCNLRLADAHTNQMNRKCGSNSLTGIKGVTFRKERNNYFARIRLNGKNHYLGTFDSLEDATEARIRAEIEMFKDFSYQLSREVKNNEQ